MKNKIMKILKEKQSYLKESYGVSRIGLFGSFAKGNAKPSSDVDIVVEFERPVGLRFMELAEYMEKLLARKVDILTPDGIRSIRGKGISADIRSSIRYV